MFWFIDLWWTRNIPEAWIANNALLTYVLSKKNFPIWLRIVLQQTIKKSDWYHERWRRGCLRSHGFRFSTWTNLILIYPSTQNREAGIRLSILLYNFAESRTDKFKTDWKLDTLISCFRYIAISITSYAALKQPKVQYQAWHWLHVWKMIGTYLCWTCAHDLRVVTMFYTEINTITCSPNKLHFNQRQNPSANLYKSMLLR